MYISEKVINNTATNIGKYINIYIFFQILTLDTYHQSVKYMYMYIFWKEAGPTQLSYVTE